MRFHLFVTDLIDTLWNVKQEILDKYGLPTLDLIDTLWNVKKGR